MSPADTTAASRHQAPEPAPRELEIKLIGTAEDLTRAMRSSEFRRHSVSRVSTRLLESVYFDTPDKRLRQSGLGLRLRKHGKNWIQTVKRERSVHGGIHDRDEYEHVVTMRWPNFTALIGSAVESAFEDPQTRTLIAPVFSTEFRRSTRLLTIGNDTAIEVAFDQGQILAGTSLPLCELELELKRGDVEALFDLVRWLCANFPLRLENRSKAERGYALLDHATEQPVRAGAVTLDAQALPDDAFVTIASSCLAHLQANEAGLLKGEDPEYLHQARVAIRRLRAALSLFGTVISKAALEPQRAAIKELGAALGLARDWDVFRTQLLPSLPVSISEMKGFASLLKAADTQRALEGEKARRYVANPHYTLSLLDFAATLHRRPWAERSAPSEAPAPTLDLTSFAGKTLRKRWRGARRYAAHVDPAQPSTLHPLRIDLKKLRYGAEFMMSLFPRTSVIRFLDRLGEIQDHLGRVNDAAAVAAMVDALRTTCADGDAREALGAVAGYFTARAEFEVPRTLKAWKRLKHSEPFWS